MRAILSVAHCHGGILGTAWHVVLTTLQVKGPFTRTVSLFVSVTVNVYHCVNGDRLFDGQIGLGTHSACQCKFDGDGDGNRGGTCKWTLIGKHYNERFLDTILGIARYRELNDVTAMRNNIWHANSTVEHYFYHIVHKFDKIFPKPKTVRLTISSCTRVFSHSVTLSRSIDRPRGIFLLKIKFNCRSAQIETCLDYQPVE